MHITVQLFASAKALIGETRISLDLEAATTLSVAVDRLIAEYPALGTLRDCSLFAIGLDYASPDTTLNDGDIIQFIPPVQGG